MKLVIGEIVISSTSSLVSSRVVRATMRVGRTWCMADRLAVTRARSRQGVPAGRTKTVATDKNVKFLQFFL